ncbi:MAG: class I SAM-dependent methyltransferase [Ruminococcaceae bacterium]|nr:class I SAM-dependent methyltransferase [Oscillospiraceae bacterium]
MTEQNIFDDQHFFDGYKEIRGREVNYNNAIEQPAMSKMLPCLTEKTVLDLGCGYGYNCTDFIERGAKKVLGIDISKKMLETAKAESSDPNIEYMQLSMTEISSLNMKFDLVYSSLAIHYIEDFKKLMTDIYGLLNNGGTLLFSQESPFITASPKVGGYNLDENGRRVSFTFSDYSICGAREERWLDTDYIKYHRTFSKIFTDIAQSGFVISEMCEPMPDKSAVEKCPSMLGQYIKPQFLIVKAVKKG